MPRKKPSTGVPAASFMAQSFMAQSFNGGTRQPVKECSAGEVHTRRCHDCGNVATHTDSVTPEVLCKKCRSQDTRRVRADLSPVGEHTPGPWAISHGGLPHDDGFSVRSNNAAAREVKIVAECWPCSITGKAHREELMANAKLIAAAPALLEACEMLDLADRNGITNLIDVMYAVEAARAAIAAAKGGA